jgi:hypothetical protein
MLNKTKQTLREADPAQMVKIVDSLPEAQVTKLRQAVEPKQPDPPRDERPAHVRKAAEAEDKESLDGAVGGTLFTAYEAYETYWEFKEAFEGAPAKSPKEMADACQPAERPQLVSGL